MNKAALGVLVMLVIGGVGLRYNQVKQVEKMGSEVVLGVMNGEEIGGVNNKEIRKKLEGYQSRAFVGEDTENLLWEDYPKFLDGVEQAKEYVANSEYIQVSENGDIYPDIDAEEEYLEAGGLGCDTLYYLYMYDEASLNVKDERVIERDGNLYIKQRDIDLGEGGLDLIQYGGLQLHIYDYAVEKETRQQRQKRKPYIYEGKSDTEFYYIDTQGDVIVVGYTKGLLGVRDINI